MRTLEKLDHSSVSELAQKMRLERSTLVRTLQPMLASGLIEDGAASGTRNRCLHLTQKGEKILSAGATLWDDAQQAFEKKIGVENLSVWYAMLEALQK